MNRRKHFLELPFRLPPRTWLLLLICWTLILFLLAASPPGAVPEGKEWTWLTNFLHAPIYAAGFLMMVFHSWTRGGTELPPLGSILGGFAYVLIIGALTEGLQVWIPGRVASVLDLGTNLCGAIMAWGILRWFQPRTPRLAASLIVLGGGLALVFSALESQA